jgi:UDP-sulfoquinovose synthase
MRVLILGGDGYLGWPTAMAFAAKGHDVALIDNYFRRNEARRIGAEALLPNPDLPQRAQIWSGISDLPIRIEIGDCADPEVLFRLVREFQPDAVVHYAEQPSAPYSMMGFEEARNTLTINLHSTFNLVWAVLEHAPDCHIIKLGTMGEYGTPNIDIEEGWLEVEHKGRNHTFLYPRTPGSLYHTTKVMDTDMLWFYVRTYGLTATDLMQGPVYGISTDEADLDERLAPNFHYDDVFGTVLNRFLVQAVSGIPLTVYGKGGQTRGFLNLRDTLQCIELAMTKPPAKGELRILNQFTETFSVNDLAEIVSRVGKELGLGVEVQTLSNPRKEAEEHYYNPKFSGLFELGLEPHYMTDDVVAGMLERLMPHRDQVDPDKIMPRVRWAGR